MGAPMGELQHPSLVKSFLDSYLAKYNIKTENQITHCMARHVHCLPWFIPCYVRTPDWVVIELTSPFAVLNNPARLQRACAARDEHRQADLIRFSSIFLSGWSDSYGGDGCRLLSMLDRNPSPV